MAEFSIIEEFCHGIGPDHTETKLSVGDDAAIVAVPDGMELAISVDTMVSGVHFFPDVSPAKLAHKILAVNLSDMAAMGAEPKWATLALSISTFNNSWLTAFSSALRATAQRYSIQIIGGDTTQGPLNLSITIMGLLPTSKRLDRASAEIGNDVYVSNYLGDAALGLAALQGRVQLQSSHRDQVISALETPEPRVSLGQSLLSVANSCLDISDGLVGDLSHICKKSDVSIKVDAEKVPLSDAYKSFIENGGSLDLALNGGDDYELAFTVNPSRRQQIEALSNKLDISLTRIGQVIPKGDEAVTVTLNGVKYPITNSYEHFS